MLTGKVPGLELVDVNDGDVVVAGEISCHLALQVEHHQFFVGGVESEARTHPCHRLDSRERKRYSVRVFLFFKWWRRKREMGIWETLVLVWFYMQIQSKTRVLEEGSRWLELAKKEQSV